MKNKTKKMLIIITICLIIIDQFIKIIAIKSLADPIGNDFLGLEIVHNTGMAFGFNDGNIKNIFLTIFVLLIVLNFVKNQIERIDNKTTIALSLVIAGGISNLIDRIFRGFVIDFIKIYKIPNFNFADICIVLGWGFLIVFLIDYTKKN